jgi:hypothetical protein
MSIKIANDVKNQGGAPAIVEGTFAQRPAAGQTGRLYLSTDTNVMYRDNGSSWDVFLSQTTVPSGLTPIGTSGQFIQVNGTATGLQYVTLGANSPLTLSQVGSVVSYGIQVANTSQNGYLSSTDWTTFNNKGNGTVTSVAALTLGTTGTDLSSTVATGTTTPVITLNVPTASATNRGALSSADWTTFNGKIGGSGTANNVAKFSASGTIANSTITDSGTLIFLGSNTYLTNRLGIGSDPAGQVSNLHIDRNILGAVTSYGINNLGQIQSTVTTSGINYNSNPSTQATAFTLTNLIHYRAIQGTLGAGSAVTNEYGFLVETGFGATNNYGFYSALASGFNFYATNTAKNFFGGTTLISSTVDSGSGAVLQANGGLNFLNMFNRQTASYTLALTDQNKIVEQNVATANNLTVPPNSTVAFPIGTEIAITQYGAGKTTIVAGAGVTLRSAGGLLSIGAQYAMVSCVKVGTNEWYVVGNLIA